MKIDDCFSAMAFYLSRHFILLPSGPRPLMSFRQYAGVDDAIYSAKCHGFFIGRRYIVNAHFLLFAGSGTPCYRHITCPITEVKSIGSRWSVFCRCDEWPDIWWRNIHFMLDISPFPPLVINTPGSTFIIFTYFLLRCVCWYIFFISDRWKLYWLYTWYCSAAERGLGAFRERRDFQPLQRLAGHRAYTYIIIAHHWWTWAKRIIDAFHHFTARAILCARFQIAARTCSVRFYYGTPSAWSMLFATSHFRGEDLSRSFIDMCSSPPLYTAPLGHCQ